MIEMYERENIAAYPKGVVVDVYVPPFFVWEKRVPMSDLLCCILLIMYQK